MGKTIGGWTFVVGLIIAVIIAIFGTDQTWPIYLLLVLGLIVGLLNVSGKEAGHFLIAAIAFLLTFTALASISVKIPVVGDNLVVFFNLINTFIAPAAAVVAFKELFAHAKN